MATTSPGLCTPKAISPLLHCCHCEYQHALTCICCSPPVNPQAAASALLCGVSVPAAGGTAQHSGGLVGVLAVTPSCINTTQDGHVTSAARNAKRLAPVPAQTATGVASHHIRAQPCCCQAVCTLSPYSSAASMAGLSGAANRRRAWSSSRRSCWLSRSSCASRCAGWQHAQRRFHSLCSSRKLSSADACPWRHPLTSRAALSSNGRSPALRHLQRSSRCCCALPLLVV